ncbi:MAG: hypothetical protein AAFX06_10145 [Planctomycetota bacterium]
MSRASTLRDAIRNELALIYTTETVESVVYPDYTVEELAASPNRRRIWVARSTRELDVMQGPDEAFVSIIIGVSGALSTSNTATTSDAFRAERLAESDGHDDVVESIFGLFMPNELYSDGGFGDFAFRSITETVGIDLDEFRETGIHVSALTTRWFDTRDECP